ncbi:MAG: type III-B CRISPR module RAMP protein Cmr6 [Armatimonadetes bacterium]|nr:type III-B CRISPR module RAMP protein Cmr6 [Armatimonadota bacterium]
MPTQACRQRVGHLAGRDSFANPGLALQRYLPQNGDEHAAAKALLDRVQASPASDVYKEAFQRYKAALPDPVQVPLELGGPLALGLGMSSPLEVGLTTLHTYGMPVIPGSAIKGVCSDYAEKLLDKKSEQFLALIGDQKNAGLCVFYDAWYVPEGDCKPFHRDVVTVHHPDYYQQRNNAWPTDFDDPNPVPFVVVKPGAKFLFAVKPPSPEWADFVRKLLIHAMTKHGVGGKVNAGYGWFKEPGGARTTVPGEQTAPTREETTQWSGCATQKRIEHKGGFAMVLRHDCGKVAVPQSEWSKLTATWTSEKRRAAEQGKLTVCASVQHIGGKMTVVAIKPEG